MEIVNASLVRTHPPACSRISRITQRGMRDYTFSRVFGPDSEQKEVYTKTILPLVHQVVRGKNALVFAYGITNAGKTYTIVGDQQHPGILPQALETVLSSDRVRRGQATVHLSLLEIYNEKIYDLLNIKSKRRVALRLVDKKGSIHVRNLSTHAVDSIDRGVELLQTAAAARKKAGTSLNRHSSRSHSVCTLEIHSTQTDRVSTFSIVDLAGSERIGRTGNSGTSTRQKEANTINTSLMKLWRCLHLMRKQQQQLQQQQQQSATADDASASSDGTSSAATTAAAVDSSTTVIPFRESKLTHLFMNHLSGTCSGKTVMIVNVNPRAVDYDETQHVLGNSAIAQQVRTVRDVTRATRAESMLSHTHDDRGRRVDGTGAPAARPGMKRKADTSAEHLQRTTRASQSSQAIHHHHHHHRHVRASTRNQTLTKQSSRNLKHSSNNQSHRASDAPSPAQATAAAAAIAASVPPPGPDPQLLGENQHLRKMVRQLTQKLTNVEEEVRSQVAHEMEERLSGLAKTASSSSLSSDSGNENGTDAESGSMAMEEEGTGDHDTQDSTADDKGGNDTSAQYSAKRARVETDNDAAGAANARPGLSRRPALPQGALARCTSSQKFHRSVLEGYINELEERIQECEDEMKRMAAHHAKEVAKLRRDLAQARREASEARAVAAAAGTLPANAMTAEATGNGSRQGIASIGSSSSSSSSSDDAEEQPHFNMGSATKAGAAIPGSVAEAMLCGSNSTLGIAQAQLQAHAQAQHQQTQLLGEDEQQQQQQEQPPTARQNSGRRGSEAEFNRRKQRDARFNRYSAVAATAVPSTVKEEASSAQKLTGPASTGKQQMVKSAAKSGRRARGGSVPTPKAPNMESSVTESAAAAASGAAGSAVPQDAEEARRPFSPLNGHAMNTAAQGGSSRGSMPRSGRLQQAENAAHVAGAKASAKAAAAAAAMGRVTDALEASSDDESDEGDELKPLRSGLDTSSYSAASSRSSTGSYSQASMSEYEAEEDQEPNTAASNENAANKQQGASLPRRALARTMQSIKSTPIARRLRSRREQQAA